jgi:hypothetical protein
LDSQETSVVTSSVGSLNFDNPAGLRITVDTDVVIGLTVVDVLSTINTTSEIRSCRRSAVDGRDGDVEWNRNIAVGVSVNVVSRSIRESKSSAHPLSDVGIEIETANSTPRTNRFAVSCRNHLSFKKTNTLICGTRRRNNLELICEGTRRGCR